MEIISAIIIGFVVGVIAKLLMPGRDPGGFILTSLLGVAGAFIAQLMGKTLGYYRPDQTAGFLASIIGAILLLVIYRMFTYRRV
jgi:uncharacterized membrane protein YeaQ/YmgE (transglycosylase-associated protein family)